MGPLVLRRAAHSATHLLVHLVWSTRARSKTLMPDEGGWLEKMLVSKAAEIGCAVLAVGNASDHVHVLLRFPPTVSIARIVHMLKGASARAYNLQAGGRGGLRWQVGYYAESVGNERVPSLVRYIREQRVRHESGTQGEPWESRAET